MMAKQPKYLYYVTTTDTFLSGWGKAEGKVNKLVFPCESYEEARKVYDYAKSRSDQKHVYIRTTKPYYGRDLYYVQFKTKEDYPHWYGLGRDEE